MSAEQAKEGWAKLKADLEWRGPTGKQMNFVCLTREQAEAMLAERLEQGRQP